MQYRNKQHKNMKKHKSNIILYFFLFFIICYNEADAQFSFDDIYKLNKAETHGYREEAKKNKIQNLRIEIYKIKSKKKEKLIQYEEKYYNENGLLVHHMQVVRNHLLFSNTYIFNDTTLKSMIYSEGLDRIFNYQYTYDTSGKLKNINIKRNGYLYDNIHYIYDDKDKLIEVNGGQSFKYLYDNNTIITIQTKDTAIFAKAIDTLFETTYDNINRVTNYKEYGLHGVLDCEHRFSYTPDSLTYSYHNRLGEKISQYKEYYNKNGNLIKVIYTYNKDYRREEYKYDDNGLITQIKVYNKKGKCIRIKKYLYTRYD